ncbi:Os06g0366632 [Oryza sativa Japonica Group]|uniref:Os06g0366632 protein n=1 Tax=Oryza sativa subsp. japonica TaxID=39947 RepID=A0A0P0WWL3_ORYSJ|nr:Os06g0366632 [Oryza sativa Japonica Group]
MASSWNLGEDDGAAVCSEMDEIDGNGGATSGGALDTEDTDELDTRCSIHATGKTKDMNELGIIYRSFFHDYCAAKLTRGL